MLHAVQVVPDEDEDGEKKWATDNSLQLTSCRTVSMMQR